MNRQLEQVKEWHEKLGVPIGGWSQIPDNKRIELRMRMLEEEGFEARLALQACKFNVTNPKTELMGNIMKELCDVIYVTYGTLLEFGLHTAFEAGFDEVHKSNMTKTPQNVDVHGKITKGLHYVAPNMEKIFL